MELTTMHQPARDLFLSLLSEDNRARFEAENRILVHGSGGGLFEVRLGFASNVIEINPHAFHSAEYMAGPVYPVGLGRVRRWCAYPRNFRYRDYDQQQMFVSTMTQMLLIETDEDAYRRVAIG